MDALNCCLDEIALDGLEGCSLNDLWNHLKERDPPFLLQLDDASKQYLWQALSSDKDVQFYCTKEPRKTCKKESLVKICGGEVYTEEMLYPYVPIFESKEGIKGLCANYDTRTNITKEIRDEAGNSLLSLKQAEERWGQCVVLVMSQEGREKAIVPEHCDYSSIKHNIQFYILEVLGRMRKFGMIQTILSKYFGLDPRSTYHHMNVLAKDGLVIKQKVPLESSVAVQYTILSTLPRFSTNRSASTADYQAEKLCKVLERAPNQEMEIYSLGKTLGDDEECFRKIRRLLYDGGYIKFYLEKKSILSETHTSLTNKTKKLDPKVKMIRLVKMFKPVPYGEIEEAAVGEDVDSGDEDNIGDLESKECTANFVAEKPLINQVYNIISEHGVKGITIKQILQKTGYGLAEVRGFSRVLLRQKAVKPYLKDKNKTKVAWFVAAPFFEDTEDVTLIKQEHEKTKKLLKESLPSTASSTTASPADTPVPSPRPSTSTETMAELDEDPTTFETFTRAPSKGLDHMKSLRPLKRKNYLISALRVSKVLEYPLNVLNAIIDAEQKEGVDFKADRKSVFRVVDSMIKNGLAKKYRSVVTYKDMSKTVEFLTDTSVNPGDADLQNAIEKARFLLFKSYKNEVHEPKKNLIPKANTDSKGASKVEEKKEKKNILPASNPDLRASFDYLPKYLRIKELHKYIWYLVCGKDKKQQTDPEFFYGAREKYEWINHLTAYPSPTKDPGYFMIEDAFSLMPLSLFPKVIGVRYEIPGLAECLNDPAMKYTQLDNLPLDIRKVIKNDSRNMALFIDHVVIMCELGLFTPIESVNKNKPNSRQHERSQCIVHVSKSAVLVDTRSCKPDYNLVTPLLDGQAFEQKNFNLTSLADLEHYWFELQNIALNTPLGIKRAARNNPPPKKEDNRKYHSIRSYLKYPVVRENDFVLPRGDGLGAAGHDSSLFVHLKRQWSNISTVDRERNRKWLAKYKFNLEKKEAEAKKASNEASKQPANPLPPVIMPDHLLPVTVPAAAISRAAKQGGKGQKHSKKRKPESDEGGEAVKKKKKTLVVMENKAITHRRSRTKNKDELDKENSSALVRCQFTDREDKLLFLSNVALHLMKNYEQVDHYRQYPWTHIRNTLHESFEESSLKTSEAVSRRTRQMLRNPQTSTNLQICLAECKQAEEFQNLDKSKNAFSETFKTVLGKLQYRYGDSFISDCPRVDLPASLEELGPDVEVAPVAEDIRYFKYGGSIDSAAPIVDVATLNQGVLRDLIQSALSTPDEHYDPRKSFNTFDQYSPSDLESVFVDMQRKGIINRKKIPKRDCRRSVPFASMSYHLSVTYKRSLSFSTPYSIFKEAHDFYHQVVTGSIHAWSGSFQKDEGSLEDEKNRQLDLKADQCIGGHVACMLTWMCTDKVDLEVELPNYIFATGLGHTDNPVGLGGATSNKPNVSKAGESANVSSVKNTSVQDIVETTSNSDQDVIFNTIGRLSTTSSGNDEDQQNTTQTSSSSMNDSNIKKKVQASTVTNESKRLVSEIGSQSYEKPKSSTKTSSSTKKGNAITKPAVKSSTSCVSSASSSSEKKQVKKTTSKNRKDTLKRKAADKANAKITEGGREMDVDEEEELNVGSSKKPSKGAKVSAKKPKKSTVVVLSTDDETCETTSEGKTYKVSFPLLSLKFTSSTISGMHMQNFECESHPFADGQMFLKNLTKNRVLKFPNKPKRVLATHASHTMMLRMRGELEASKDVKTSRAFNYHDAMHVHPWSIKVKLLRHEASKTKSETSCDRTMYENGSVATLSELPQSPYSVMTEVPTTKEGMAVVDKDDVFHSHTSVSSSQLVTNSRESKSLRNSFLDKLYHAESDISNHPLSIQEFVDIGRIQFSFNEDDVSLIEFLCAAIKKAGNIGVELQELVKNAERKCENGLQPSICIHDHINMLKNFSLVVQLGVGQVKLVWHNSLDLWCISVTRNVPNVFGNSAESNECQDIPDEEPVKKKARFDIPTQEIGVQPMQYVASVTKGKDTAVVNTVSGNTYISTSTPTVSNMKDEETDTLLERQTVVKPSSCDSTSLQNVETSLRESSTVETHAKADRTIVDVPSFTRLDSAEEGSCTDKSKDCFEHSTITDEPNVIIINIPEKLDSFTLKKHKKQVSNGESSTGDTTKTTDAGPSISTKNVPGDNEANNNKTFPKPKSWYRKHIPCRPWIMFDGKYNTKLYKTFQQAVLIYIMEKPGVTRTSLNEYFVEIMRPVALGDILEILLATGCITQHFVSLNTTSLFSVSDPTLMTTDLLEKQTIYYLPTLECVPKLALASG